MRLPRTAMVVLLVLLVTPAAAAAPARTQASQDAPRDAGDASPREPINTVCPVMPDEGVDPRFTVEWNGHVIGFCCRFCPEDFLEDPEAYLAALPPEALVPGPAAAGADGVNAPGGDAVGAPDGNGATPSRESPTQETLDAPGEPDAAGPADDEAWMPRWFGRAHVIVVHFPIALIAVAAFAEFVRRRGAGRAPSPTALYCLRLGTAFAFLSAWMGWSLAESYATRLGDELFLHRWLGVATSALALIAMLLGWRASRPGATPGADKAWRIALLLATAALLGAGHFGGVLVHGPGYLFG